MICALLCDPGPGDTLRFFHALCEMSLERKEKITLFCLSVGYKKTKDLLRHMRPFSSLSEDEDNGHIQSDTIDIRIADNTTELNRQLQKDVHGKVFYCFETRFFQKDTKVLQEQITTGIEADFILLDRYQNQRYIRNSIKDHLIIEPMMPPQKGVGLLFVRVSSIVPERNMSSDCFRGILELGRTYGIQWKIAEPCIPKEFISILNLYEESDTLYKNHHYPNYYEQICNYSKYQFAIGMNSGALDLAAAAGIPIIRIGEYHHCLPYQGLHYNDFLAGGRTVNILSNSEVDISNITIESIKHAFDLLLESEEVEIVYV